MLFVFCIVISAGVQGLTEKEIRIKKYKKMQIEAEQIKHGIVTLWGSEEDFEIEALRSAAIQSAVLRSLVYDCIFKARISKSPVPYLNQEAQELRDTIISELKFKCNCDNPELYVRAQRAKQQEEYAQSRYDALHNNGMRKSNSPYDW